MAKGDNKNIVLSYFCVFVLAAILYTLTCAPGALWQDSGMYQYRIWHNDIQGRLGLALAHPLYHVIGIAAKTVPLGEFAFRINLISAFFGALTVANIFLLLRLWLEEVLPAVIGAITLAVSWTFFQHCCIAEVYTLYTAIFTAELIFLFQYFKTGRKNWLYILFLFNGLSISNHMWGLIPLVCYVVFAAILLRRKTINGKDIIFIILLWSIGAALYLYLIVRAIIDTSDLNTVISSALFGEGYRGKVLNVSMSLRIILQNIMFIGYNFLTPNILLLFVGLYGFYKLAEKHAFAHMLAALTVLFLVFAFRYKVPDRYAFFIPFYCLAAVFIGAGAKSFCGRYQSNALKILLLLFSLIPVLGYKFVPDVVKRLEVAIPTRRQIPYRDDYEYFLQPWKGGDKAAELFASEALECVDKDSIVIADGTTVYPLWYCQEMKGLRPDVKIVSGHRSYTNPIELPSVETINRLLEHNSIYVVSPVKGYCPGFLLEDYDFVSHGLLYQVVPRN
jgi:hypothetical protein